MVGWTVTFSAGFATDVALVWATSLPDGFEAGGTTTSITGFAIDLLASILAVSATGLTVFSTTYLATACGEELVGDLVAARDIDLLASPSTDLARLVPELAASGGGGIEGLSVDAVTTRAASDADVIELGDIEDNWGADSVGIDGGGSLGPEDMVPADSGTDAEDVDDAEGTGDKDRDFRNRMDIRAVSRAFS